jgi:hypothetical protein
MPVTRGEVAATFLDAEKNIPNQLVDGLLWIRDISDVYVTAGLLIRKHTLARILHLQLRTGKNVH